MRKPFFFAIIMACGSAPLIAQTPQESNFRAPMQDLVAKIQSELEAHGERVLGKEVYRWSTRLQAIADCRAEFSVRITSNLADATVRTERVNFSLGAIDPHNIELKKNWLALPCEGKQKCISSSSNCSTKTKAGVVTDCTSASQKRVDSFDLQLDGDASAAARLEQAFHEAADLCRTPVSVAF